MGPRWCPTPTASNSRRPPEPMAAADHLQVPRRHGLFMHHGIDLGDGTVAHYLEGKEILRSPLDEFSRGEAFSVVAHPQADSVGRTLRRALSRIGEQQYNLLFNNCEHFAVWCKTGRHRSAQVEQALGSGALGALAMGQLLPAAALAGLRILLQQGLGPGSMDQGLALARRTLADLEQLRQRLQARLERELLQTEGWWTAAGDAVREGQEGLARRALEERRPHRLAAQALAEQLEAVEDLEARLQRLLGQADPEGGADPQGPPE